MKEKYPAEAICPKCGKQIGFDMWNYVDADLNIEETYELTSGTFFRHTCPECGAQFDEYHSLNFNDPRSKTLVRYIKLDAAEDKMRDRIMHCLLGDDKAPNYTVDVVFDPTSFVNYIRSTRFRFIPRAENASAGREM